MNILVFVLAGLFCGFIDSCLGMGFGVTSASVLISFGVAPAIARLFTGGIFTPSVASACFWRVNPSALRVG